jgi:predicted nucleic acid-binding protein
MVPNSTVLIAAERAGSTPRKVIADIIANHGDVEAVLSVITVIELAHGIERAHSNDRRLVPERFLDEFVQEMPVEYITTAIAFRAGRIDGSLQAKEYGWRLVIC